MKDIDIYISEFMATLEFRDLVAKDLDFQSPVTLTYALERLTIVHCKLWMLEDQVRNPNLTDAEIGALKRKIDYLNGVIRPRLVESIGQIFAKAVKEENEELVREPNLKDYKSREIQLDDMSCEQLYDLSYEEMKAALKVVEHNKDLLFEVMVNKYYIRHHKELWPQIEMRLFSIDADTRFTAVACLSICKYHTENAVALAKGIMVNDSNEDVRRAARALVEAHK